MHYQWSCIHVIKYQVISKIKQWVRNIKSNLSTSTEELVCVNFDTVSFLLYHCLALEDQATELWYLFIYLLHAPSLQ